MDYKDILKSEYFNETYSKIEQLKKDFYVNHGFIHILGVIDNAKYLADLFGLSEKQKELLLVACTLHDIGYLMGREGHAKNGGILAREYLKGKMPEEDINLVVRAIASHGGKTEEDFRCPVSMCLILADKLDFTKKRYKDDGNEHRSLKIFKSVESIVLKRVFKDNFKLLIYSTNVKLFENFEEDYFFGKLIELFKRFESCCGKKIEIEVVQY